ncbi:MAG: hypothetical protein H0U60_02665 [Blastocatellia bacterium]|nr:hypothetical protein [Blastocatellia bacterium]
MDSEEEQEQPEEPTRELTPEQRAHRQRVFRLLLKGQTLRKEDERKRKESTGEDEEQSE